MKKSTCFAASILALTLLPVGAWADPPAHAPAHGYRGKDKHHRPAPEVHSGVEVVFDSERGVHIAVGLPGLFFDAGHFYRHTDDGWQMSARPDGGWKVAASVPAPIVKAKGTGPAKHKKHR